AAEHRLDARDDLCERERLRDVVVAARTQCLDLVLDRVLGGEEEDRGLEAALAHPLADLDARDVREHPVEDDEVRLLPRHGGEGVAAVRRLLDLVALVAQRGRDRVDDRTLVVDDEDPAGRVLVRWCHGGHGACGSWDSPVTRATNPVRTLWIDPSQRSPSPCAGRSEQTAAPWAHPPRTRAQTTKGAPPCPPLPARASAGLPRWSRSWSASRPAATASPPRRPARAGLNRDGRRARHRRRRLGGDRLRLDDHDDDDGHPAGRPAARRVRVEP